MTFNWQERNRRHGMNGDFLSWLVITSVNKHVDKQDATYVEMSAATKQWTEVTITMQINGVEVDNAESFLERMGRQYDEEVLRAAGGLLDEHLRFTELEDSLTAIMDDAREAVRQKLRDAGIVLPDTHD